MGRLSHRDWYSDCLRLPNLPKVTELAEGSTAMAETSVLFSRNLCQTVGPTGVSWEQGSQHFLTSRFLNTNAVGWVGALVCLAFFGGQDRVPERDLGEVVHSPYSGVGQTVHMGRLG